MALKAKLVTQNRLLRGVSVQNKKKQFQSWLLDKDPEQLKLSFAWWSREAVRRLIKQQPGLEVAVRTMETSLKRWGFTPQKPVKRAYQRNDPQVLE